MDTKKKKKKFKDMMGPPYIKEPMGPPKSLKRTAKQRMEYERKLKRYKDQLKRYNSKAKRTVKRSLIPAEPRNTPYRVPQG